MRALPPTLALLAALALLAGAARADDPAECRRLSERALPLIAEAERTGDPAKARTAAGLLARACVLCPQEPDWPFQMALAWLVARDRDRVEASLEQLRGAIVARADALNHPRAPEADPRVLYVRALLLEQGSALAAALDLVARLKARTSSRFMPEAVASLEFRLRTGYASQLVHARDPDTNQRQRDLENAVQQTKLAIAVAPTEERRRQARRNLGQIYRISDRYPEAEREFVQLAREQPKDAVVRYSLASVLADQLRFDEAVVVWEETLALLAEPGVVHPAEADTLADAGLRHGMSLVHAGAAAGDPARIARGRARVQAWAEAHPRDARGWYQLGVVTMDLSDAPKDALPFFEKAHALDGACEQTMRRLLQIHDVVVPDPARKAAMQALLDSEEGRRARAAEMERRKRTRPDGTTGCE